MGGPTVRIGVVGAGANTRAKHIPGLQAIEGVDVVSVANRTRASGGRVAREFGIPKVYDHWADLVEADDSNAIVIGTWPYMHCAVAVAALNRGKHTLCEARMAMNAREARLMLGAARRAPGLTAQLVPAPGTLPFDEAVREIVASGELGSILAIEVNAASEGFMDAEGALTWRQGIELSGMNTMNLGIVYESLMRWVGPASKVAAMSKVFVKQRRDSDGGIRAIEVPDHVDVLAEMACGAMARMRFSAVAGLGPEQAAWIHGAEATLKIDMAQGRLYLGRKGDSALAERAIPQEKRGGWRVEEEFVNAIRGKEPVRLTTFEAGVRYMEFTEAVHRSAREGRAVNLPL